jgi:D-3-phosphoglycerate dehydrogenase
MSAARSQPADRPVGGDLPAGEGPIVLVLEPVADRGLALLAQAGLSVVRGDRLEGDALQRQLAIADAILVRSGTKVDRALIDAAPCLRAIARAGVGLDNVDVEAATRRGIAVMNTPGGNALAAAEHSFALLLSLARHVAAAHASLARGEWKRHEFVGTELAGKRLGIIGLGKIGSLVAVRARAFDMHVLCYDPYLSDERARTLGVEKIELDLLLATADVVTLHVPLTESTREILSAARLARLKPTALVVNCARGGLIDEQALADALRGGRLAGAALDVFAQEPPAGSPLVGLRNVVHTPHLGASTREATENVSVTIAEALTAFLRDGDLSHAVNLPYAAANLRALAPLMDLAERLGRFQAGLLDGAPTRVEVEAAGDEPVDVAPLTQAFLSGLLRQACGEEVNAVNARLKANDRGLAVTEGRGPAHPIYPLLVCTRVHDGARWHQVDGGVLAPRSPRIVRVDSYWMDVQAIGNLLVMTNADVPGVMGKVGTLLGERGINIGEMRLGRGDQPQHAISLWQVDEPVPPAVLGELRAIEEIADCRQVKLGAAQAS